MVLLLESLRRFLRRSRLAGNRPAPVGTYAIQLDDDGANSRTIGTATIAAGLTADVVLTVPANAR